MPSTHPLAKLATKHWQSKDQKGKTGKASQVKWSPSVSQEVYDQTDLAIQILPSVPLDVLSRTGYLEKVYPHDILDTLLAFSHILPIYHFTASIVPLAALWTGRLGGNHSDPYCYSFVSA